MLSVGASSEFGISYQWYNGEAGDTSEPVEGATLAVFSRALQEDTRLWVRLTDENGFVDSESVLVKVLSAPTVEIQTNGGPSIEDGRAALYADATGGNLSYQWYAGESGDTSSPVVGGLTATLVTQPLSTDVSYWVRVWNVVGTVDSATMTLSPRPLKGHTLLGAGDFSEGELGIGKDADQSEPVKVAENVEKFAAGVASTMYIDTDGTLWALGAVAGNRVADGEYIRQHLPVQVDTGVAKVDGYRNGYYLKDDGTLWGWGSNAYSQLALPRTERESFSSVLIDEDVVDVSQGQFHLLYVKTDGTLWGIGDNREFQLGSGAPRLVTYDKTQLATDVVSVEAGEDYSLFIKNDGSLWGMGRNWSGQLGNGAEDNVRNIEQITTDVEVVRAGVSHTLFIKPDGSLWGTGSNASRQLGVPAMASTSTPLLMRADVADAAGGAHFSIILDTSGDAWTAGANLYGELADGSQNDRDSVARVMTGVAAVDAREFNSLFLKTDGSLWGAGSNRYGQLGVASWSDSFIPVDAPPKVLQVAAGEDCSYFITIDGRLWAMGDNYSSKLGDGTFDDRNLPVEIATNVRSVAAASEHALLVKNDNTLWGIGYNEFGQLANAGRQVDRHPVQITTDVATVVTGQEHTLFIKTDGTLWGMGRNRWGELGVQTSSTEQFEPVQIASNVVRAAAGVSHSTFIKSDGTMWATGTDGTVLELREPGVPAPANSRTPFMTARDVVQVAAVHSATFFLKANGDLYAVGFSRHGELGTGVDTETNTGQPVLVATGVMDVSHGGDHALILKRDGSLWATGFNEDGQLGLDVDADTAVPIFVRENVAAISAGSDHSLILVVEGMPELVGPFPVTIDAGETATLEVSVEGDSEGLSYQWFAGQSGDISNPVSGATEATYTTPLLTADASYWLRVSRGANGVDSETAEITVLVSPYEAWQLSVFGSLEENREMDDPDFDGLPNILEYALGRDPRLGSKEDTQAIPVHIVSGNRLALTFRRVAAANITYIVEASDDLFEWEGIWTSSGDDNVDGEITVEDIVPVEPSGSRFLRLKVLYAE